MREGVVAIENNREPLRLAFGAREGVLTRKMTENPLISHLRGGGGWKDTRTPADSHLE